MLQFKMCMKIVVKNASIYQNVSHVIKTHVEKNNCEAIFDIKLIRSLEK